MRDAFLERIWMEMARDGDIFFITADFGSPVLDKIRGDYPDRFVNVGIAEQNLINVTAGLALEGFKVFAYAIAPFITMRCYEQLRVNLALLSEVRPMNVTLVGVGAGYSYVVSGPTHQCYEDLTLMRALPNVRVFSPPDHVATAALFEACLGQPGIKYLRLDAQILPVIYEHAAPKIEDGFHVHRQGEAICLLATGFMMHTALVLANRLAEDGVNVGVIDLIDVSRMHAPLLSIVSKYQGLVSMEEGFRGRGGMDAMLFDAAARHHLKSRLLNIGVEPGYRFELGTRAELHEQVGIGIESARVKVLEFSRSIVP
ncbi:MAG: transketolase [Bacteroidetes bacterium]|nr:transketolase [Bacteroidota bacterium]